LDCAAKELTRELKETDLNGVAHVVESQIISGVNDIRVVMNELTRTDISIFIQSNSDMKTIETQITFRK
jgi:PIN domain nuclease of toxin-antitoxin system